MTYKTCTKFRQKDVKRRSKENKNAFDHTRKKNCQSKNLKLNFYFFFHTLPFLADIDSSYVGSTKFLIYVQISSNNPKIYTA